MFTSILILPLTNYDSIKLNCCASSSLFVSHKQSKSLLPKREKSKECLKTAFNQQECKMHMRSNSHGCKYDGCWVLAS